MALNYKFEFILTDPNDPDSVPITREIISTSNAVQFIPLEEDFGKDLSVNLTVYNQYGQSTQQQDLGRIIDEFPGITVTGGTFNSELVRVNSTVDVTPIYFGGNPETPVIQYNFVDQTGESLQNSTSSSYTITPDDLNSQLSVIIIITDIDGRVSTPFPLLLGTVADEFPNPFINSITVTGAPRLGNTVTVTEVNYAGGNPNNPVFEYEFVSRDANDGTEQSLQLSNISSYDIPEFDPESQEDDELLDKILLVRVKVIDVDGRESNIETESLGVIDDLDVPAIESFEYTGEIKLGNTITVTDVDYIGGNQNDPPQSINYKFFVNGVLQTSDGSSYEIPIDFDFIGKILNVEVQLTDADGRESQPYTSNLGLIIDQYTAPIISSFEIDGEILLGRTVSVTNVTYSGGNPIDPTFEYEFVSIENGEVQSLQSSNSPSYDIPAFDPDSEEDDELLGKILRVDFKVTDADGRESPTVRYILGTVSDEYSDITMSLSYSGKPYPGEVITATIDHEGGNPSTDNPDFPEFTFDIRIEEYDEYSYYIGPDNDYSYTLPISENDIGKRVDITGTVEDVDGRSASQILSFLIEERPATEPPTIDAVTYDGDLNPGQDLDITVEYTGYNPPYKIEYEVIEAVVGSDDIVIESGETTSKTSESNFQYTIQVADLGKTLGVKVKVFDNSSPPLSSQELRALIGDVSTTISLDITTDVDNDEKADIYDDEVKVQSPDVPSGKLLPKWFMKYRG